MSAAVKLRQVRPSKAEKQMRREARKAGDGMALPGLVAEQKRMLANRISSVATPRPVPGHRYQRYVPGPDVSTHRAGANDFLQIPSRFCDVLRYRDGRSLPITPTNPKA